MSHFAKVENGIVTQVIVAEQDFIDTGAVGHGWIQTSYNTLGNQHPQGRPLRGNYAGIGYTYDDVNDVFIAPKPFDNWVLDTATWLWNPPIAMPVDEYFYTWNQETTAWDKGDLRPVVVVEPVVETPVVEPVIEAPVEPVVESVPVDSPVVEPEAVVETPVETTPQEPEAVVEVKP
jgi:hypothetical protein